MTVTDVADSMVDEITEALTLPADPAPIEGTEGMADPDAPYGRRADGTPKAKPGPKKAAPGPSAAPRRAPSPSPRKTPKAPAAPKVPDYRPAIMGLLQVPTMALTMIGRQTKNPALQADGYALALHAPNLAEALNETAKQQPQVARALENILKAGPYGAIIAAVVPLAMQLAANHRVIAPVEAMGIHAPEQLVEASEAQVAAMAGAGA